MNKGKKEIEWWWHLTQNLSVFHSWNQGQEAGNEKKERRWKEGSCLRAFESLQGQEEKMEETSAKEGSELIGLF